MEEIDQISWDIIFSGAQLVYEVVIAVDFFQVLQIFAKSTADYPDLWICSNKSILCPKNRGELGGLTGYRNSGIFNLNKIHGPISLLSGSPV